MRLLEWLETGVYKGDSEAVDPSTLAQYCAGSNGCVQSITKQIVMGQEIHARHPPVEAAQCNSPSHSTLELETSSSRCSDLSSTIFAPLALAPSRADGHIWNGQLYGNTPDMTITV